MMKKTIFTGSGVALVTPMNKEGSIDYDVLKELIEFHVSNGTDAIVACGTTGESPVISDDEHRELIQFIVKQVNKRIPVVAGAGSNNTHHAAELACSAQEMGADALLVVTPYYNKTSQKGLIQHYTYIADRVDLPIIAYNVPSRTSCNIAPATYLELSKHPNIVAAKEANGDISALAKTISLCGDNLDIYSGNDNQTVPILAIGGKGVISVLANIVPGVMHKICKDYFEGNYQSSLDAFLKYIELMDALFMDVNPVPVKAAMEMLDFNSGECRLPLTSMTASDTAKLSAVLKKYQLAE